MHIINGLYLFGKRMLIINDVSHNTAETGRFATTTRGGTLTVTNGYNLRGWLTSIESTPFREYLYYEQPHNGSTAQYGGNISSMDWKTGDNILRGYTFQYDGLSRLTGAAYSENGSASTHYGTSYQYDLMGNITGLTRSGLQDDNTPVYHYYLQDHLGNNRVVVKQDGTVEQVNHYYPYGGLMGESIMAEN